MQKPSPQPLSVLHVHSGNLFGGIERALLTCVDNLCLAPHLRFEFALCFQGRFSEHLKQAGQTVHQLPEVRSRNPFSILSARRALWKLLQQNHYDAVLCHSPWSHSIFAPVFTRSQTPELFWAHNHYSGSHWLERWASRTPPAFVISNSHYTDRSLAKIFPGAERRVVYCPADLAIAKFGPDDRIRLRRELETPTDSVVILQAGRLEQGKGHAVLLEAAANLGSDKNCFVWIVGGVQQPEETRYLQSLRHQAQQMGIADRVRFAGERNDVHQLMAGADVFCQPNLAPESFGLVFIEALAMGLPVITFDMGGASEIVDETCGILVPPRDRTTLGIELKRLVGDPELRRRLSAGGPPRARELCDPERILPELECVITEVVRKGGKRTA